MRNIELACRSEGAAVICAAIDTPSSLIGALYTTLCELEEETETSGEIGTWISCLPPGALTEDDHPLWRAGGLGEAMLLKLMVRLNELAPDGFALIMEWCDETRCERVGFFPIESNPTHWVAGASGAVS